MKLIPRLTLAAALLASSQAFAGSYTLDFEAAASYASMGIAPNSSLYTAFGVSFAAGGDLIGLQNNDGLGSFSDVFGNPVYFAGHTSNGAMFAQGAGLDEFIMNTGNVGEISFDYSAVSDGFITAFSGANGTGASQVISLAATDGACPVTMRVCQWGFSSTVLNFSARSFSFGGIADVAFVDNITLVPEPASVPLVLAALGALTVAGRRRG